MRARRVSTRRGRVGASSPAPAPTPPHLPSRPPPVRFGSPERTRLQSPATYCTPRNRATHRETIPSLARGTYGWVDRPITIAAVARGDFHGVQNGLAFAALRE